MGRVLQDDRRQSAIQWWRRRLAAVIAVKRPTIAAVTSLLEFELTISSVGRDRLPEAVRKLIAVLALPEGEQTTALNEWLGKHLVDRRHHLLVDQATRNRALLYNRNRDRRAREKPLSKVNLQIPADIVKRLRLFARKNKLADDGQAIAALLAKQEPKSRQSNKPLQAGVSDLFDPAG